MPDTPSSPSLAEIADLLEKNAGVWYASGMVVTGDQYAAAASALRSLAEVMPDVIVLIGQFEQHSDPRFGRLSARLRSVGTPTEEQRDGNV